MLEEYLTRGQFWFEPKEAEASNTVLMPTSSDKKTPEKDSLAVISKTADGGACPPEGVDMKGMPGEQADKHPQAKLISSRVDVSSKEPPRVIKEKTAQYLALPSQGRYPLDSYSDIEKAAAYFETWASQLSPAQRHEYCENLVKRASEVGVDVSPTIQKYGSAGYANDSDFSVAIAGRKSVLSDEAHVELLDKVASHRAKMPPSEFVVLLEQFDKAAGIGHLYTTDILDPYFSTFGVKVAAEDADGSYTLGNDYVTKAQLRALANSTYAKDRMSAFTKDMVKEFRENPITIFESLPDPQKKIIARIANDTQLEH